MGKLNTHSPIYCMKNDISDLFNRNHKPNVAYKMNLGKYKFLGFIRCILLRNIFGGIADFQMQTCFKINLCIPPSIQDAPRPNEKQE